MRFPALLACCAASVLFGQTTKLEDVPIATVGSEIITQKEFLSRYELTPGLHRHVPFQRDVNKAEFLLTLIAEKLLAQEARGQGLETDSAYRNAVNEIERLLTRDELYQREVRSRVRITEEEIRDGVSKSQVQLKVYFLFAATAAGAKFLSAEIAKGKKLETFSFVDDTTREFEGLDSAIARWGDVDERMDSVLYGMKPGETSLPLQLDDGFYIAKIMEKTITFAGGEREKQALRERAEQILRRRKEQKRMFDYMANVLRSEKAEANAKLFRGVADAMHSLAVRDSAQGKSFVFYYEYLDSLRRVLQENWNSPFVVFPHTRWTLGLTLAKIFESRFAVEDPTPRNIRLVLDQRLRDLIDQEHLTERAYAENLNSARSVREEVAVWGDSYLAALLQQRVLDTMTVVAGDSVAYFSSIRADSGRFLSVKIRKIVVDSLPTADEVVRRLRTGESFVDLMHRFSTDDRSLKEIGREKFVPAASLGDIAEAVSRLKSMGWTQPIRTQLGYVVVQLLEKRRFADAPQVAEGKGEIREKILKWKQRSYLDRHLGHLAGKYGVTIYQKNFDAVEVSGVPAMVYRFLGFGGRIFAVPLIEPQADWVKYWDSKTLQLP